MNNQIFTESLPQQTAILVSNLQSQKPQFLDNFYLSGGTALALQLNHRQSEDLDFFSQKPFDPLKLEGHLIDLGKLDSTEISQGTLNTYLNGVKLQFLEYPYKLIRPTIAWNGINLSSIEDIACTKLQTISSRGSKKDFIDLYFILKQFPLDDLIVESRSKYEKINYNQVHILKSLVYFNDADKQPMPRMLKPVNWDEIKANITQAVKTISLD